MRLTLLVLAAVSFLFRLLFQGFGRTVILQKLPFSVRVDLVYSSVYLLGVPCDSRILASFRFRWIRSLFLRRSISRPIFFKYFSSCRY